jgi:hypothetical protein
MGVSDSNIISGKGPANYISAVGKKVNNTKISFLPRRDLNLKSLGQPSSRITNSTALPPRRVLLSIYFCIFHFYTIIKNLNLGHRHNFFDQNSFVYCTKPIWHISQLFSTSYQHLTTVHSPWNCWSNLLAIFT